MNRSPLIELPAALLLGARPRDRQPHLLLGVDGGATKTQAAVLDLRDGQLRVGRAGPSNPDAVGVPAAIAALVQASEEAMSAAGVEADELDAAVLTVAGTDLGPLAARLGNQRPNWIVVNDVVGAWAAATRAQPGIGVIAGTGSNVLGIGADNRAWRAGGWGHVLGDEGSGYWLAVQRAESGPVGPRRLRSGDRARRVRARLLQGSGGRGDSRQDLHGADRQGPHSRLRARRRPRRRSG